MAPDGSPVYGELTMTLRHVGPLAAVMLLAALPALHAEDAPAGTPPPMLSAVARGVTIVEKAGRNYPTHRKCFACHHQTLPLLALNEAQTAGAKTDEVLPGLLAEFTTTSFRGKLDDLKAGENIGGKGLTVGYGLWTLRLAQAKPDDRSEERRVGKGGRSRG